MNYQWPHPFSWSNGNRGWVTWLTEDCLGVEKVYPDKNNIKTADPTVGHYVLNSFGVYDMYGGVEEWVLDWYDHYSPLDTIDPIGPAHGDFKVVRGGSHNNHVFHTRSANRMSLATNDKRYFTGFRVVRVPKDQILPDPDNQRPLLTGPLYTHNHSATIEWSAGIANDGRYIQNGDEKWYYPNGKLKYEAILEFDMGVVKEAVK